MLAVYAVDVVDPDIDRGDIAPWWSLRYDIPATSVAA
jgi:hypothetical protein